MTTIIQKFVILAALTAALALSAPVENNDAAQEPASCCARCIMQDMGSEYCERCFQANGGC